MGERQKSRSHRHGFTKSPATQERRSCEMWILEVMHAQCRFRWQRNGLFRVSIKSTIWLAKESSTFISVRPNVDSSQGSYSIHFTKYIKSLCAGAQPLILSRPGWVWHLEFGLGILSPASSSRWRRDNRPRAFIATRPSGIFGALPPRNGNIQSPTSMAMSPTMSLSQNSNFHVGNSSYRHQYPPVSPADQNPPCKSL